MSIIPVTVPTGAIRYNTDSNKMECFNGTQWMEVSVTTPDLNGGARGFHNGGRKTPGYAYSDQIDAYNIATAGSVFDFGDMTAITNNSSDGGCGNATRAVFHTRTPNNNGGFFHYNIANNRKCCRI